MSLARRFACATGAPGAGAFSARYGGGRARDAASAKRTPGSKGKGPTSDAGDEGEWMQRARRLANQRAAQFRKERGAPPVAPAPWPVSYTHQTLPPILRV